MNMRPTRVLLVVIAIAIGWGAGYFLYDLNTRIEAERVAAESLRDRAKVLSETIASARVGQISYVANGQSAAFWMAHVQSLLPGLQERLAEFAASLTAPGSQAALTSAAASLDNFRTLDGRVREFVTGGNSLLASDLIFSDGLEAMGTASTQVGVALTEELQVISGRQAELRTHQLIVLGGAAGGALLLMLALALSGTSSPRAADVPVAAPLVEPVRFEAPMPRARPAVTPKLIRTAQLCSELARVVEAGQLPDLLERTARVLDASGLIVWLADPAGQELRPAMSHGYSAQVIAKMGGISCDASNAAAAAYRSAEMRTVAGDSATSAAVVAPLMTSEGCIGVLSAEVKGGVEKDDSSLALAAIFAAQLATLVSPAAPSAPIRAVAQG